MTWLNVLLYGPGWIVCVLIPLFDFLDRRDRRRHEQRCKTPPDKETTR